ncbi:hypothetical protein ACFGVS_13675 [Mucilaginibacter sp. AW1-7]|uniref:hypothetical protein n=1 Tax=Mucilaginibacter sp. AW1-7 TaxID=3349874 RepID=UPI003F73283D
MMSTYNILSNKIPSYLLEIIDSLQKVLGRQSYDFLLIGASARDLIMDTIYDLGVSRMTRDVDFALYVPEWDTYKQTIQKLIDSGLFSPTKTTHKLIYKNAYEIDIVPFGAIQDDEGQYTWPPDHIKAMNVAGFVEVSAGAIEIQAGDVCFKIASVPGICVMKILAWKDRGRTDDRDGRDLGFILGNYIEMKYEDLYSKHQDLMEQPHFDRFVTTARIMGRDIRDLLKSNLIALEQIKRILLSETDDDEYSRLALSLKDARSFSYKTAFDCIKALIQGMVDVIN